MARAKGITVLRNSVGIASRSWWYAHQIRAVVPTAHGEDIGYLFL